MFRTSRSRRTSAVVATVFASVVVLTGCNPPAERAEGPLPESEDELIAAAQAEGQVSLGAGGHTTTQAQLLADKFEEKYGITVDFVRENSGQISQKVEAQRDAGNVSFDVISLNDASTLTTWADEGVLAEASVENAGDIIDLLEVDSEYYIGFTWAAAGFVYNEVKADPADIPTTWDELAATAGRKVVADPGGSGAALTFVAALDETDPGFLSTLGEGDVLTSESALALGQMVSTGEADFGLPGIEHEIATAQAAGEPLKMGYPEGELAVLPSYIAALSESAHPAAARLLVQYSLSEEFQEAQREIGSRSVLDSVDDPEGLEALGEDRMLLLDQASVSSRKDDLLAAFEEALR